MRICDVVLGRGGTAYVEIEPPWVQERLLI